MDRAKGLSFLAALGGLLLLGGALPGRDLDALTRRVEALERENRQLRTELTVDRLVVRNELIVSDNGQAWEKGFEAQQIPRGIVARSVGEGVGGLWVRSRLIKGEIDDPFDDRFHAIERDGSVRRVPGHISWNIWKSDAWRQMAIVQGEGLEPTEPGGDSRAGRLRVQTFRPDHDEPLTDALIGQGKMALGGGGFGGGGLPYAGEVLELWGGRLVPHTLARPEAPKIESADASGTRRYAIVAVGPQGTRSAPSPPVTAAGRATLLWDSVAGADAYVIVRDGKPFAGPLRVEGSRKRWTDPG